MLVLARQRDQTIKIGDDIEVTVVDVRGDKVRLGINAPRSVSVHRKEIYDAIRRENASASHMQPRDIPGAAQPAAAQALRLASDDEPDDAPGDPFMRAAIRQARKGLAEGGLPVGAVLVRAGQIIGAGHNRRVQNNNPMAHAEIDCLANAGRLSTYKDTVLYTTLMPCYLCAGAVIQFGIPKVVAGESANFGGASEMLRERCVEVVDLHNSECIEMMRQFTASHPDLWHEDSGK